MHAMCIPLHLRLENFSAPAPPRNSYGSDELVTVPEDEGRWSTVEAVYQLRLTLARLLSSIRFYFLGFLGSYHNTIKPKNYVFFLRGDSAA